MDYGPVRGTKSNQTTNAFKVEHGSETTGAKIRGREGNSPERQLRSLRRAKWKRM